MEGMCIITRLQHKHISLFGYNVWLPYKYMYPDRLLWIEVYTSVEWNVRLPKYCLLLSSVYTVTLTKWLKILLVCTHVSCLRNCAYLPFTDCTKSLPQLTDEELASGLATKILVELVQREDSQQKHFSALFFTLLPESCESGVDVSSLRVTDLLREKSITSAKLIQRLISLGMKVNESDVTSAVLVLMERHRKVLQLLAEECARTRKSTFTSACQEAIKAKKLEFVCCLIENGGAPDVEDLKDLTGWPRAKVDPVIDDYLRENTRPRKSKAPEPEEPHAGLPDRASALVSFAIRTHMYIGALSIAVASLTLGVHAQRGLLYLVCLSVPASTRL